MKPQVTTRTVGAWCVAGLLVMLVGGSFTEALFGRVGYPAAASTGSAGTPRPRSCSLRPPTPWKTSPPCS